ncbi:hypothetical protein [Alicyclobacillus fastidiosus]|uniref:Methyltransferase domain-containing protein n=1 Tax=Alicyclobacillus fastidiosus TaxID=392011 RepID=A0ABV5AC40_9BACL
MKRHGFAVTGVDFADQALKRLESFSEEQGLHVNAYQRDLDDPYTLADLGCFDNILVVHFKPTIHTFQAMSGMLRTDGILLMTSFNVLQHARNNFPKAYCYAEREYVGVDPSLELLDYLSYADERGYFDGYIFRKM